MRGFDGPEFGVRGSGTRSRRFMRGLVMAAAASWLAVSVAAMAQEPVRTEPVVVTATRIEEKVSEQASSVSVVTREEMDRMS
ncbi:MAG TPA: hypothetical protein VLB08_05165, partial [Candidatus Deferrimicrobium sp.]|nr:hypothetical protein [Candidatus Deferrimicrobium sp.]